MARSSQPFDGKPRIIMRIEITPQAKAGLLDYCDRAGKIQIHAVSRIVEWFSEQPCEIQSIIMGDFPSSLLPDVSRLILKRLDGRK
jgi:hypothetical protein